ncbi:MAG TPA: UbiD family decarboxylase [Bacteroidota bacterium]|nr:UbiD family decarboxylase [Bacteroidota bacterium]
MAQRDFRGHLAALQANGELHRTNVEVDPALELTEVSTRALKEGKPALLVERPKGSEIPLVVNHFASSRRIELALGRHPDQIGEELIGFLDRAFPPTLKSLLEGRRTLKKLFNSRPKNVHSGDSQQVRMPPDLDRLPIQICWPKDGGRFITYGQVITYDPGDGKRNIGIYRLHVYDKSTTGMHWQIQKGGGFHYFQSEKKGKDLELAVALGTDPALTLATVAALPEGFDEAMFAGFLQGRRVEFTQGRTVSIFVPASAEFVLEGLVPPRERRMEGPFGDHFGHYSDAAEFPVFHVRAITHRRNPIYPAIVVGKPPMEDKFLGDATQQILGPLVKLIHKEVKSLWAYYEAGFHNLLVVSIEERYAKEAMKTALGLMGTGQLSLTKCLVTVSAGIDVRDWHAVLHEIREQFEPHFDFIMIPKVPLDTLDFTSYKMNLGSKMIIDATKKRRAAGASGSGGREASKKTPESGKLRSALMESDARIRDANLIDDTLLLVKTASGGRELMEKLVKDPRLEGIPVLAVVSDDVDIYRQESYIWGIFTRFDCERDVFFTENKLVGISPIYRGVMGIDATWKPGYPAPLVMSDEIVRRVDEKWGRIWK